MRARAAVIAANVAFLVTSILRLLLLAMGAPIAWFGLSLAVEAALAACLLAFAYRRDRMHAPWSISLPLARRLLGQSWPLLLRSEEHTSELQSLMRISYAVFCLKKKTKLHHHSIIDTLPLHT